MDIKKIQYKAHVDRPISQDVLLVTVIKYEYSPEDGEHNQYVLQVDWNKVNDPFSWVKFEPYAQMRPSLMIPGHTSFGEYIISESTDDEIELF